MATAGRSLRSGKEFRAYYDIGPVNMDALIQRSVERSLDGTSDVGVLDDEHANRVVDDEAPEEESLLMASQTDMGMDMPSSTSGLGGTEKLGGDMLDRSPPPGNQGKKRRRSSGDEGQSGEMGTAGSGAVRSKRNRRADLWRTKHRAGVRGVDKPLGYLRDQAKKSYGFLQTEKVVEMEVDGSSLRHAHSGFVGLSQIRKPEKDFWTVEEVLLLGFDYKAWDGILPEALCDGDGRVVGVLAGQPTHGGYLESTERVGNMLKEARIKVGLSDGGKGHRRGRYCALSAGVSFGGGQQKAGNLVNTRKKAEILKSVMSSNDMRRVVGFGSHSFGLWAPKLFKYYEDMLDKLYSNDSKLERLHSNSVFPATTINCGPQTVTVPHVDGANLPFGWCSVTALGKFDALTGGHLVLWDAKLVIEFPAGSTILIPSGSMVHSNTLIGEEEERASVTQYCAGGLFRWVEYGFKTASECEEEEPERKAKVDAEQKERWLKGVDMFSKLSEL
ncbi:hypothetical protein BD779DRAFT_1651589 [Infundibulicybe gibba]|nr:hypothetical protein BD779DRAFT_1651589 [Infundibulicybe gibba]